MIFAPILIMVYTRKQHFMACVESLAKCRGAQYTTLFISSDGGKDDQDRKIVADIRSYCATINGFAKVEVLAHEPNLGGKEAYMRSIDTVFSQYDRLIYTEDDNLFAPNFLEFINGGLNYYEHNSNVFSICGYKHPLKLPKKYDKNVFTNYVMASWGMGLWRDKYRTIELNVTGDYWKERKTWHRTLSISWSELMEIVLKEGKCYGDVIMGYWCMKKGMVNIFPSVSLVRNVGNDGSGVNCASQSKFSTQEIACGDEQFNFIDNLLPIRKIERRQANAIDFPFTYGRKLFFLRSKRVIIKYLRDYIEQRQKLKSQINRLRNR